MHKCDSAAATQKLRISWFSITTFRRYAVAIHVPFALKKALVSATHTVYSSYEVWRRRAGGHLGWRLAGLDNSHRTYLDMYAAACRILRVGWCDDSQAACDFRSVERLRVSSALGRVRDWQRAFERDLAR